MATSDRIPVNKRIGGRKGLDLNIYVRPEDEEYLRAAADDVDKRVDSYRKKNPELDLAKILMFIAVEYASNLRMQQQQHEDSVLQSQLEQLNNSLERL